MIFLKKLIDRNSIDINTDFKYNSELCVTVTVINNCLLH
jgi:hypothetical protein